MNEKLSNFFSSTTNSSTSVEEKRTLEESVKSDLKTFSKGNSKLTLLAIAAFIANTLYIASGFFDTYATKWTLDFDCVIPALKNVEWTSDQIRNLTSASSCEVFNLNYAELAQLSFDDAWDAAMEVNETIACEKVGTFKFNEDSGRFFNIDNGLVCEKQPTSERIVSAFNVGCILGAILFGILGDR